MKSIVSQDELSKAIAIVSRAVDQKTSLPILLNILMQSKGDSIKLTSTNMKLTISVWIPADIEVEGSTTLPTKMFSDLVNTMPNPQVSLNLDTVRQNMKLVSGKSVNDIKCIDAGEFPPEPKVSEEDSNIVLNLQMFRNLIRKSSVSAYTEDQPKILSGALLRFSEELLTMGTVDGQRASEGKMPVTGIKEPFQVIVPARNLMEFAKIAPDDEETVEIFMSSKNSQIIFKTKNIQLTSNTMGGAFPEYWKIFPATFKTRIKVSSTSFFKAVKQAEIFAREGTGVVRIKTEKNLLADELRISSNSKQSGANNATIESETTSEETDFMSSSFAVSFVKEILETVETPNIFIELGAPGTPVVIREDGNVDYIWLMMPRNPKIDDSYEG